MFKEVLELVHVIELMKLDVVDYNKIKDMKSNFIGIQKKYPSIDWDFLDNLEGKSKCEINSWIENCTKIVHVL